MADEAGDAPVAVVDEMSVLDALKEVRMKMTYRASKITRGVHSGILMFSFAFS